MFGQQKNLSNITYYLRIDWDCYLKLHFAWMWPNSQANREEISAHANGGPRSRVWVRFTLRSSPIDMCDNFPARMFAESTSNISPNQSEVILEVSESEEEFWKYPLCLPQSVIVGGGFQNIFLDWNPNIFFELGAHAKFRNPMTNPIGILV